MTQFINSLNEVRKNYKVYDEWEQKQADERARKEYLAANLEIPKDQVELTKKRAEAVVRATEIMDARSEDNCQDVEQMTGVVSTVAGLGVMSATQFAPIFIEPRYSKKMEEKIKSAGNDEKKIADLIKKRDEFLKKLPIRATLAGLGLTFLTAIGFILWGNAKQKEASRIGRFQAKHDELKGLENFVIYTPEQLAKAQEIAKTIPDEKERKGIFKMVNELKAISKDKRAYKQWLANKDPKEIEKLKQLKLSPEQLVKAEAHKELIVDTVKEINIKAEEYSENVENTYDTLGMFSWLMAIPVGMGLNKILRALKASPTVRQTTAFLLPMSIAMGVSLAGTFEEKNASRVGRYKARKDILDNPQRLMAFSQEDMKKAEHIKAPKQKQGFFEKLGDSFGFLFTYLKDKKEYKNYKETTQKENEKIQKAFKQIETTDAQKAEAQALKKNMFRAFDEIDEMSQRFSEDTEAGAEIAKQSFSTVWGIGSLFGVAALGAAFFKGKLPISNLANKIVNMSFKSDSTFKKAINDFYAELSKGGKSKIVEFQKALVQGKLEKFFDKAENAYLLNSKGKLLEEFGKITDKMVNLANTEAKTIDAMGSLFDDHLKNTAIARWTKKILIQITKISTNENINKAVLDMEQAALRQGVSRAEIEKTIKEADEIKIKLGTNFTYKNYDTMINTGLIAGVPLLATMFAVPYAFNAWLTNIQKKAGKIGIMKAMDNIDDARVFAGDVKTERTPEETDKKSTNLLSRIGIRTR